MSKRSGKGKPLQFNVLMGGGVMGAEMRAHDWAATALGPVQNWPQPLKTLVGVMLAADQPMFIGWGPTHVLLYNDGYAPMLADRHPHALGCPFFEVWPEVREVVTPLFDAVARGEPVHMDDLELTLDRPGRPDEAHFAFSYTPIRDEAGEIVGLFSSCIETTDQVLSERLRREDEASERNRLWVLTEDMLARADFQGRMTAVNPAWTTCLGWPEPHLLATPYAEFMHSEDVDGTLIAIEEMKRTGQPTRFENRIANAAGGWTPIAWTVSPEPDGENFIAVGRDLTEDKARQDELLQTQEALRQAQKLEAIGQLTGGVAHDFNNLLTVIRGSVDLLRRPDISDERRARYIDAIGETAERASKLTGQLLAFARRQTLQPKAFDVRDAVKTITSMIGTLAGSRIEIECHLPEYSCFIEADPSQFDTALVNIAINARDAMDGEGGLTISVDVVSGIPALREKPAVEGAYVAISVSDTGIGIEPDLLTKIFEPFFTTKEVGRGTGLGLSQVFGFSRQSGGDVQVVSEVRQGTKFTIYLPQATELEIASEDQATKEMADGHGLWVLVVEDNSDVGRFAMQALGELGYRTVWTANGEEALEVLKQQPGRFDIVFSDVVMPGITGVDLGLRIRELYHDLPVILTSGYSHVLAKNGTYGFDLLHKPYSMDQLSQALLKAASWHRRKEQMGN